MNRFRWELAAVVALIAMTGCKPKTVAPPAGPITFNQHLAPVLFQHCAPCHRPGQSAPFPLLTFADAQKRAKLIVEVTARRDMPPWLPDGSHGEFIGDRRLTDAELDLLRRWLADGATEGAPRPLPPAPQFPSDWPLGTPDLVVSLAPAYAITADGPDVYRIFVLPLNLKERRHVRAVDFRANSPAIHHALMGFDRTGDARRLDARDPEPGFNSFNMPLSTETPNEFLGWHPGKQPGQSFPGLSWTLPGGADLVLQLHLHATGKPEVIAPTVAFYFTNEPPTNQPAKYGIASLNIAIPPGASNHVVRDEFTIAGDCDLLAIEPHAHLLAREFTSRVRLPDGTLRTLLHVPRWDFNWQDYYRYATPVSLPAGSVLQMEIAYDNSAANPNNPHQPPQLVRYGLESSDEMAVINFQLLPRGEAAAQRLNQSFLQDARRHNLEYNTYLLERDPNNTRAHVGLARALFESGRLPEAATQIAIARKLDPRDDDAAWFQGVVLQFSKQPEEARAAFLESLRLNPGHPRARGCLAVLAFEQGALDEAERYLQEVLRFDPADNDARAMLRQVMERRGKSSP